MSLFISALLPGSSNVRPPQVARSLQRYDGALATSWELTHRDGINIVTAFLKH
jgi:hypothetical protein